MFAPFFFTPIYATSLSLSTSFAFHTLSIMNGASLFGRIGIGSLADRFGAFNLICISSLVGAVVAFCWTAAETQTGVGVWAAAYGFSSGVSLPPSSLSLSVDLSSNGKLNVCVCIRRY